MIDRSYIISNHIISKKNTSVATSDGRITQLARMRILTLNVSNSQLAYLE